MDKGQLMLLNCKKDKLGHRHIIHINKFGQMTQIPLKIHTYPHPHNTPFDSHPTLSNLKLLRAFESFLTNVLMCIRCLWPNLSFLQFSNFNCPFTNWKDFICLFPKIILEKVTLIMLNNSNSRKVWFFHFTLSRDE